MPGHWTPPKNWNVITTLETHAMGEPLRIYTAGLPEIRGKTILAKRRYFRDHFDHIRTGTLWEPRGHADMYGAVITEPVSPGSDVGVFFLHGEPIIIESILGTCMTVKVVNTVDYGGYDAVIPEVTGTAAITGQNQLCFNPDDPRKDGFLLR